ncbi:DNA primase/polymerase [Microbacterium phage DizzyRudy]|nr:DNA primase/polymerase [Microbacterium phage DizzyRudy]
MVSKHEEELEKLPDTFKSQKTLDFFKIKEREAGKSVLEVYPDFVVKRSKDLMVRAKSFYGIWDEDKGLWSTNEYDVQRLVDDAIRNHEVQTPGIFDIRKKYLADFSSNSWLQFRNYVGHLGDNYHQLDSKLTFRNTPVVKEDYVSRRLPYDLAEGDISAWDELVGTLYDPENRAKLEWAIGAIVAGDSKSIHKFLVLYGSQGTGKSTILNIIQWMFEEYWTAFVAKELTSSNNSFALEAFKNNPMIAIDHDGDLSKIQDNSKLNALVAHEPMELNEKNKPKYMMRFIAMMFIGSNSPVKITDSRSGLIRRLIDVHPTGETLAPRKYQALMGQIKFELGAIAYHCQQVYLEMGKDYYAGYRPVEMMLQTDVFFNFIELHYDLFEEQGGVTLQQAFDLYKVFTEETGVEYRMPRHKLRTELANYFENFDERAETPSGIRVRSWFSGFKADKFKTSTGKTEEQHMFSLVMEETESLLDKVLAKYPAQYSVIDKETGNSKPRYFWDDSEKLDKSGKAYTPKPSQIVNTKLSDLDTSKEHYVKVPLNHIVIDFDLKDADGKKSAERNLEVASTWPKTYAEFSKSGEGIHLHYWYQGDVEELSRVFDDGIEVKVYSGNSALRRKLSRCNAVAVADLVPGQLPLREKKMMDEQVINGEKHLRALINKALRKEHENIVGTKSNIDFIYKVLDDAYKSGQSYNVTDMRQKILTFAAQSSNQSLTSIKLVQNMKFASEDVLETIQSGDIPDTFKNVQKTMDAEREVIFDVEVFQNLFVVCWMYKDAPKESIVAMVNPTAQEIEKLMSMKLVGFFNRQYDNHILYGRHLGYDNARLYDLSQKLVNNVVGAKFGLAYNLSYTDIYDFAATKMSLKKWEIELGIHHMELGIPWDEPVPDNLVEKVVEYCKNDVWATNVVRNHLEADFIARQILADLSGLSMNATTQQHTAKIVFGDDRNPQSSFVYTNLGDEFQGYEYKYDSEKKAFVSTYKGETTGEGGYVYSEPGMYENVVVLDVESMHPTSIEVLNLFGDYTKNFSDIKAVRVAIKNGRFEEAKQMLGGKLARYLNNEEQADALSYALKIVINIVYGLTSAKFDNAFRDPRNMDNIVAKRGALFMIELKAEVQSRGFRVVHIKTDSIKIPNATQEIIDFVKEFGAKYGYNFVHEATYSRFCLVNDAVYIAKYGWAEKEKKIGTWDATGAQFQHPYVYKYLFSKEKISFKDMCETKTVQKGAMYIDYEGLDDTPMALMSEFDLNDDFKKFVGKAGQFCPMEPGTGGGFLVRKVEDKYHAVQGAKGFVWMESEMVEALKLEKSIDQKYYNKLVDEAIDKISKFGDFEWFVGATEAKITELPKKEQLAKAA